MKASVQPGVVRWRLDAQGAVQGVGFRPFVFRLATELGLIGEVRNTASGACMELEGTADRLEEFSHRLYSEKPPACRILSLDRSDLEPAGGSGFRIVSSDGVQAKTAALLPDLATCDDCLAEIADAGQRRHAYPFTNCTNCGPRYSIIEGIPYDRPNTTMAGFAMCGKCRAEYENPRDRRFHAQPIACPVCGPQLAAALEDASAGLAWGEIVALKGIGGFQLLADARNGEALRRLRDRKRREEKPFAVMFPDAAAAALYCEISAAERELLHSQEAPIVLLRARTDNALPREVSMSSPFIGAMLPYSPLHHLLLQKCKFPVVATSGNLSDEPIAIDNREAEARLGAIADTFLTHNRPIARPLDDSVARVVAGEVTLVRRARGYAPMPVPVHAPLGKVLALGAHLKNTVAITAGRQVVLSQHIGDLETSQALGAFERAIKDLCALYEFEPDIVACDLHPDYHSTRHAETLGLPVRRIQHHMAHVAACAAEFGVEEPFLGVAWDGTGYGTDGVIWGSEFFLARDGDLRRVAHLAPFRLPGGESAVKDCRRTALSLLNAIGCESAHAGLPERETALLDTMLRRGVNSPWTTSMGRLFDAVAALAGIRDRSAYEGQAPLLLEAAIEPGGDECYPLPVLPGDPLQFDWREMITAIAADKRRGKSAGAIARQFHDTVAGMVITAAAHFGCHRVVLGGGVFQNAYLLERIVERLRNRRVECHWPRLVPANDGGIALGQAVLASAKVL